MKRRLLITMLVLAAATACGDATGPGGSASDLVFARERWAAHGFHDYRFTLQRACFCGNTNPMRITVIHDTVASVTDLTTSASLPLNFGMTVDDLFGVISTAQHAGMPIEAQFDRQLGYPTHIVDNGPGMALDAGAIYSASDMSGGVFVVASP